MEISVAGSGSQHYIYICILFATYIWKPALLVVYIYIYVTRVPHPIRVFCFEYIYIHMHSKHVYKPTFFIFYLYDILSAGGNYFFFNI